MKIEKFANISKWIFTLNTPSVNNVIKSHVYSEEKKAKDLKRFEFMQNLAQRTPFSLHQCYDILSEVETDNLHEFENIFEGAMTINEIAVSVYNRRKEREERDKKTEYCNSCHEYVSKGYCSFVNCRLPE